MRNPVGWFGKLPSLGDFASRRLPGEFIEAWDAWLSGGLADWQASAPDDWLADYLASPSRGFIVLPATLPGTCGTVAWAGVLMPSVDRVGRYFPFTLAQPLAQLPVNTSEVNALLGWLHRLENLAVDALHEDWSVDQIEAALLALLNESTTHPQPASEYAPDTIVAGPLPGLADPGLHERLKGHVLWLTTSDPGQLQFHLDFGLPGGEKFNALFNPLSNPLADPLSDLLSDPFSNPFLCGDSATNDAQTALLQQELTHTHEY